MSVNAPTQRSSPRHGKPDARRTDRRHRSSATPRDSRSHRRQTWPARSPREELSRQRTIAKSRVSSESNTVSRNPTTKRFPVASLLTVLEQSFVYLGFAVSVGLIAITASDLLTGFPFKTASVLFDWGFLISGLVLFGLSLGRIPRSTPAPSQAMTLRLQC